MAYSPGPSDDISRNRWHGMSVVSEIGHACEMGESIAVAAAESAGGEGYPGCDSGSSMGDF